MPQTSEAISRGSPRRVPAISRGREIRPPRSSALAELMLEAMSPKGPGWSELAKKKVCKFGRVVFTISPRASLIGSSGVGAAMATAAKRAAKMVEKRMLLDTVEAANVAFEVV